MHKVFGTTISVCIKMNAVLKSFYKRHKTITMNRSTSNNQELNSNNTQQPNANTPMNASDSSRNNERDQRIKEEQDTERLRSERESTMNNASK